MTSAASAVTAMVVLVPLYNFVSRPLVIGTKINLHYIFVSLLPEAAKGTRLLVLDIVENSHVRLINFRKSVGEKFSATRDTLMVILYGGMDLDVTPTISM